MLLLVAGALLRVVRSAKPQKTSVNRNIDVFRKAFDDLEDLGQRGAPLENQVLPNRRQAEQLFECPAGPKILLDDLRQHVALGGSNFEENSAFLGLLFNELIHGL